MTDEKSAQPGGKRKATVKVEGGSKTKKSRGRPKGSKNKVKELTAHVSRDQRLSARKAVRTVKRSLFPYLARNRGGSKANWRKKVKKNINRSCNLEPGAKLRKMEVLQTPSAPSSSAVSPSVAPSTSSVAPLTSSVAPLTSSAQSSPDYLPSIEIEIPETEPEELANAETQSSQWAIERLRSLVGNEFCNLRPSVRLRKLEISQTPSSTPSSTIPSPAPPSPPPPSSTPHSLSAPSTSSVASSFQTDLKPKKKIGRPRKIKDMHQQPIVSSDSKPKKKMGRPRKIKDVSKQPIVNDSLPSIEIGNPEIEPEKLANAETQSSQWAIERLRSLIGNEFCNLRPSVRLRKLEISQTLSSTSSPTHLSPAIPSSASSLPRPYSSAASSSQSTSKPRKKLSRPKKIKGVSKQPIVNDSLPSIEVENPEELANLDTQPSQWTSGAPTSLINNRISPAAMTERRMSDELFPFSERLETPPLLQDGENDIFGKNIACKLKKISPEQRVHAEKLINDVMYYAQLERLNIASTVIAQQDMACVPSSSGAWEMCKTDQEDSMPHMAVDNTRSGNCCNCDVCMRVHLNLQ